MRRDRIVVADAVAGADAGVSPRVGLLVLLP